MVKGDGQLDFEKEEVLVKGKNDLKKLFFPERKDHATEAARSHHAETKPMKKCKNHIITKLKEWLHENLTQSANDVQFLREEEQKFNDVTKASNDEALQLNEMLDDNDSDKWCGSKPWMRISMLC